MTRFHYLTIAYALLWIAMGVYLISLGQRLSRLADLLGELRARWKRRGEGA
jgi:CcmD family protein